MSHVLPYRRRPWRLLAPALALLAACTSVPTTPSSPLDASGWRSAKSRMYQDLARQCLRAGDHERARSLMQQAVQFDASDAAGIELLARLAHADGDLETAAGAARLLQRLDPESVAADCTLGAVAEARNQLPEAEACYRRAAQRATADARPLVDLHRLLLLQQRDAEASSVRATLDARFPRAHEAARDHGASLAHAGRWSDAAAAYDALLLRAPEDAGAATGAALANVMALQPGPALSLGQRLAPRARADNPTLALTLAIAHLQAGDCQAALRELDRGNGAARERADCRVLRGELLLQLQLVEAAQAEFEAVLVQAPDDVRSLCSLGRIHLERGRGHAAVRCLERVVQLQPDHTIGHALLAAALTGCGETERAVRHVALAGKQPAGAPLVAELARLHPALAKAAEAQR